MVNSFKDLLVWQKSMDLLEEIYRIARGLPREEQFALSDQMRRAVVSIPSNIAEGQVRKSTKEYAQFLSVAKGSNAEVYTQILICVRLGYLSASSAQKPLALSEEISKMLSSLIQKLTSAP